MSKETQNDIILGEVISGAVSAAIQLKLRTDSEEVKIGFPAVIEGKKYDFFSIISDITQGLLAKGTVRFVFQLGASGFLIVH